MCFTKSYNVARRSSVSRQVLSCPMKFNAIMGESTRAFHILFFQKCVPTTVFIVVCGPSWCIWMSPQGIGPLAAWWTHPWLLLNLFASFVELLLVCIALSFRHKAFKDIALLFHVEPPIPTYVIVNTLIVVLIKQEHFGHNSFDAIV